MAMKESLGISSSPSSLLQGLFLLGDGGSFRFTFIFANKRWQLSLLLAAMRCWICSWRHLLLLAAGTATWNDIKS
jgi:hypothetical protein